MLVGSPGASTQEQDLALQLDALKTAGRAPVGRGWGNTVGPRSASFLGLLSGFDGALRG